MKTATFILLLAAALTFGMGAPSAVAQNRPDEGGGKVSPQLPVGVTARYRVTYFYSNTNVSFPPRNASIVSVTNQNTVSCTVAVDWRFGSGPLACGTSAVVGPGATFDFCTRTLPFNVVACNSTCPAPGLTFVEGSAVVGSSTATTGCEKIAVSARTVYTGATADTSISAITDAKVVRVDLGNRGD